MGDLSQNCSLCNSEFCASFSHTRRFQRDKNITTELNDPEERICTVRSDISNGAQGSKKLTWSLVVILPCAHKNFLGILRLLSQPLKSVLSLPSKSSSERHCNFVLKISLEFKFFKMVICLWVEWWILQVSPFKKIWMCLQPPPSQTSPS